MTAASPLLSIVMPVFNVAPYLEASFLSVLNQPYKNFEIIVVNDASTDESIEIAKFFEAVDKRVRVIDLPYNTPGGAGIPSNVGIKAARGKYIGFLDSDDFYGPDTLSVMMSEIIEKDADLCIANFYTFTNDSRSLSQPYDLHIWRKLPKKTVINPQKTPSIMRLSPVPWRKIYKRSFLEKFNIEYPEVDHFFEDNPLHWAALGAAQSVVIVDDYISYHRMARPGQTMSSNSPQLAALLQHITLIAQRLQKASSESLWLEFIRFVGETRWIISRQTSPMLADIFTLRFSQIIDDHIAPYAPKKHSDAIEKLKARFSPKAAGRDLTVLIHHDSDKNDDASISRTIHSLHEIRDVDVDIIVLHTGDAPALHEDWRNVLYLPAGKTFGRSFNRALPLCTGRYVAFLKSGDTANANSFTELNELDVDIISAPALDELPNAEGARLSVYSRRFLQDRPISFGTSEIGALTFQCMVDLNTTKIAANVSAPLFNLVNDDKPSSISFAKIAAEADTLLRLSRPLLSSPASIRGVMDIIAEQFRRCEKNLTLDAMKEMEVSRSHITLLIEQILDQKPSVHQNKELAAQ